MKKIILSTLGVIGLILFLGSSVFSQGNQTAREEAEGKVVWEKLQAKQVVCKDLSKDNFEKLGEYFMGQMLAPSKTEGMGTSHEVMNTMMKQMMGEEAEEQMHILMGKRMTNCEPNAALPQAMIKNSMMPMMTADMMGNFAVNPTGWFNWIFIIFWLVWIILGMVGIVALIKWLMGQSSGSR